MIELTGYEPIGDGLYIEYADGPATRYMHATPALMLDLAAQHRRRRDAPCGLLERAAEALQTGEPEVAVEAWRAAYQELVDDIRWLKDHGLRHDTPHTEMVRLQAVEVEGLGVATPIKVQSGLEGFIARQRGT
jgi:hypothetical protein